MRINKNLLGALMGNYINNSRRPLETGCEVNKFWNQIKQHRRMEIVKDYNQGWAGIGVPYVPSVCD